MQSAAASCVAATNCALLLACSWLAALVVQVVCPYSQVVQLCCCCGTL